MSRISGVFYLLMMSAYYKEEALFKFDEVIDVKDDQKYLTEILTDRHYEKWFSQAKGDKGKIFVLNKGRCGNGGTMGFINYAREQCKGLIVSVPNRSIVISKERYDECCCVYGGAENVEKNKNIRICTWDKTDEVAGYNQFGFENIDIDDFASSPRFWAGSLLVVDEYHKLVDDSSYREVCKKITKTILTTNSNVVLMSATPNYEFIKILEEVSGKEIITIDIKYDDKDAHKKGCILQWYDRKKGARLYDILNEVMRSTREEADKQKARMDITKYMKYKEKYGELGQVVVFFSSVDGITKFVNNLPDTSEVEVLCSEKNKDIVPCYSGAFNKDKRFHFLTSAYFTGMDIDTHIDKVIIIGSNSASYLAYSNKEIKQMLGRMRAGYESSFVFTDGKKINKRDYDNAVAMKERCKSIIQCVLASENEEVKKQEWFIDECLNYLYNTQIIENMEGWIDGGAFKQMMSVYPEYTVKTYKMKEARAFKKKRDISFTVYKEKRLEGIKAPYKYSMVCEKFIEKYGLERFAKATRSEIELKVKLDVRVGDVEIDTMRPEDKYDFLLGDGYYRGSYLMSVLDYLGEKCDYEGLERAMNNVFGCFCVYVKGDISKLRSCWFLCVLPQNTLNPQKRGHLLYIESVPVIGAKPYDLIRVSKKVSKRDQKTQAITDYLDSTQLYSMIEDGDEYQKKFFTILLKDPTLMTETKQDTSGKKLFDHYKMNQTMISEFYKDTPSKSVKYPHKKEEMEKIDCLIVDIDDSITYDEFKEIYSDYEWTAYPTISNYDPDNWRKFRVVIPLAQTLLIPNDSLNVLKLLRRMVCKYEDKNHQLGSYINKEQWDMRRVNNGKVVAISQDTVVYLDTLLKNLNTYDGKFKKVKADGGFSTPNYWDIDRAIAYYQENDKDGERHRATFVIKNRLSEDDCTVFEKWFAANHYDKMHHWKSHKRIAS